MGRSALLALLVAVVAAAPVAGQKASPGQVSYVEGVRAFDAGDYAGAATRMRVAIAEDPREGTARFRYRAQNAEDYFPHLWLGLSLEKLGERGAALPELRESERQGAVDARPALRRILASALARLAPPAAPTTTPAPTPSPEPLPFAATPLPTETAVPPAASTSPGALAPAAVPARATSPSVGPPGPRGATASSPAAVRAGLRAFFRGDYAAAEVLLGAEAARSARARLYLAYSLGGRWLLSATRDEDLLVRAKAERAAALRAGAPAAPSPWVSPAILGLFGAGEEGRGAAPPAPRAKP